MRAVQSSFDVVIDNLPQIAASYSDGVAARVLHEIWKRFAGAFRAEAWNVCERPWGITVSVSGAIGCVSAERQEAMLVEASRRPVTIKMQQIVPRLRFSCDEPDRLVACSDLDAVQYRMDMCAAALAYEALDAGNMHFAEQPIVGTGDRAPTLYYECLARLNDSDGAVILPGAYIGALERLGLMRAFDRHVVREVVRQLHDRPDVVLGCNISALSAADDIWWTSALAELRRHPDVAQRLVIEITETAALPCRADAIAFIAAIRETGARVAIDDFGAGHSSAEFAREAKVDIVKIDGSYVRNRRSDKGQHMLAELVSLVGELAPAVVVEGIESAADLQAALATGAHYFQGYHFQAPPPRAYGGPVPFLLSSGRESIGRR